MLRKYLITAILSLLIFACSGNNRNSIIEESGTIEATESVISSQAAGKIIKIIKDEGAQVRAGDTIIMIDHEALDIQRKQMIANREIAKAQLDLLINGARKEDINQSGQMLNQTEANYEIARSDKERMENLIKANTITQKQYEDARARFDIAQAQLNSAKENFNKIKNIARPEEIAQAKANYQKAEAVVESIDKNIRDCYVTSPMNGFVIKKFIELGETVSMLSSLFKLADLSKTKVTIYVSETEIGKIKLGQKAEIKVDSFPDKSFEGKVIYISSEAEFTPKNIQTKDERTKLVFAVKIEIPNQKFELKTGLPADIKLIIE
ncbi:MAG: efflux RND transporter periplasmic adaptor subunit [Ignavibacteriales bacterium]|nr:efflux RND transporter periplasmic adaptor subunit [Ignavibacteriales bacterium]